MSTNPTDLDTLKAQDAEMRAAWSAFRSALDARRRTAQAMRLRAGEFRLDNTWGEITLLDQLTRVVNELPTGDALDVAAGRAILAERARRAEEEGLAAQRARDKVRWDAAMARNLERMNRSVQQRDVEREQALAALAEDR